jgi:3',5'-cyclic AMP phosphodiesterase CpdA
MHDVSTPWSCRLIRDTRENSDDERFMLTLFHISDLHFGPHYVSGVGEAVLRAAAETGPDVIVASGDFTQRAKPAQFAAARTFLDRLPKVPLLVVPGNHDIPLYRIVERMFTPYALYRQFISSELDSVVRRDDAVIVTLNTTSPLRAITHGRIERRQLELCAEAFAAAPSGVARIVVAHHHFAPAPDYDNRHDVMRGGREALAELAKLRVDVILGGHLHRAYIGNSLDVYPSQDRSHGIIIVQSGTTTSQRGRAREREKNTFNVIQMDADTIGVAHWMYFHEQSAFTPVSRHVFPRRPRVSLDGPE